MSHTFHIPVLGLGFSVDTPLKVARYGISSVMSIVDDELTERMREYHCRQNNLPYEPIHKHEADHRAKRITAYLNLVKQLADAQFEDLKKQEFKAGTDITRYFELLPDTSQLKQGYDLMMEFPEGDGKTIFENILRKKMIQGAIDVNIMAKVDKMNFDADGHYYGDEYTDAIAALRGFANSDLSSSVVLSAGMNPKLYSYLEHCADFFPDQDGNIKKKVILKVSDFRSAFIQAKFLAKKGLWVSEFRIESGLNCGGHAFATEGYLLGPILEEFKLRRASMQMELFEMMRTALTAKSIDMDAAPKQRITVQGGIGTAEENNFLMSYYQLDGTGWGSPFLLVPEATNVDKHTLAKLATSTEDDYYTSNASPLGVLFNNFRGSTIEDLRLKRMDKGRPGSPCTKKFLLTNTEFTEKPICTASREYQRLKIAELDSQVITSSETYEHKLAEITEKICLCEGLCASAYLKYDIIKPKESTAVAVCPGPNLAYFDKVYSLDEMVGHIYGKINLLQHAQRPHLFLKELQLYTQYWLNDMKRNIAELTDKKKVQLHKFKEQLLSGISYYQNLFQDNQMLLAELDNYLNQLKESLSPTYQL
ncbi:hypothetical protein [Mucilaginibacter sp.]|uniref:hypothetical protein n=1 Tax=Mucilaginibacter sp. TaxID=1882438 RepID=UPI000CBAEF72|nr:hypothetical protein [Mucilaginibacter sp.]PLW89836.1 MAG: hypothetical protein C0154_09490 [Mucilaginibacter sp.]HEK19094.1 hypothetical protein [Bacteroidota bacterium]